MPISVGIDLGTTFSAVAVVDPKTNTPRVLPNAEGKNITPSIIWFDHGTKIFGSDAEDAFSAGEPNCAATFKRSMGEGEIIFEADGQSYTAEDLSAILLRHLKEDAEAALHDTIRDAVITVPAYFYSLEREATIHAAEKAGLKVKKIIDEPNAAAMAYGINNWRENANIMVYDLGGGTFDVTLIRMIRQGELRTIVTRGDHMLGGRDWDLQIERLLTEKFEKESGMYLSEYPKYMKMIRGMSEGVKKKLTSVPSAEVKTSIEGVRYSVTITRKDFERETAHLLERTGAICNAIMEEAGLLARDLTDILLVGGSTRMPQVSEYLFKLFGKKPLQGRVNPDEAVALGAAIQATKQETKYASLSVTEKDGKKVTDRKEKFLSGFRPVSSTPRKLATLSAISLQETTAHAMGIVAISKDQDRYYNEVIIPANHPRPVRAAKRFRFYTSPTEKNELEIYVLQGDNENPLGCQIPYKFIVSGIEHVPRGNTFGTVIRVQYSYDDNGVIRVQARQEDGTVDLPIRKAVAPTDIDWLGEAPKKEEKGAGGHKALSAGVFQSVVHQYKPINFSNVEWVQFDNVLFHAPAQGFDEPKVHVVAKSENIEFHGYNVSQMDEGVKYTIDGKDDFEIECDINTSTISPHPGGYCNISLGVISAHLNEVGGTIFMDKDPITTVGAKFHLQMLRSQGNLYAVYVDGKLAGEKSVPDEDSVTIIFSFAHDSHCCSLLSHAYITDITMMQRSNSDDAESTEVDTWDD